jgi:hypothetical protein
LHIGGQIASLVQALISALANRPHQLANQFVSDRDADVNAGDTNLKFSRVNVNKSDVVKNNVLPESFQSFNAL